MTASYPPLIPPDGGPSDEQLAGQGWQNGSHFFDRPDGERPYAEVIGDPVDHSLSPAIHNFWLEKLGMTADYRRRRVSTAEVGDYVAQAIRDPLWRGCNVTMPLKRAIIPHVSLLALRPEDMPAVNTVFRYRFGWPGALSTDGAGFWNSFAAHLGQADSPRVALAEVQIVGSGATALTVAAELKTRGIGDIRFYCRNVEAGRANARSLQLEEARVLPLDRLAPQRSTAAAAPILVNATPLGMAGQPDVPVALDSYPPDTTVIDLVYEPRQTALIREARRRGFAAINGLPMLIEQAAESFRYFFLARAPREHDPELMERLGAC